MSSVLPDVFPSSYGAAGGSADGPTAGRGPAWSRRAPQNRGVTRTTECPCAVRLYHLTSSDIAARSEYCSAVLGAPSVGIQEAVRSGAVASPADASPASSSPAAAAVVRPIAVQLAWADTTVWEVAHTALQAVRAAVDAAFTAERRRRLASAKSGSGLQAVKESASLRAEEDEEAAAEAEAPFTSRPHRYEVELLTGSVNAMGQASLIPLCVVACRQVLPGHPALLPMRRSESVDYNTALYELHYNLGDPVFVTCKRIV